MVMSCRTTVRRTPCGCSRRRRVVIGVSRSSTWPGWRLSDLPGPSHDPAPRQTRPTPENQEKLDGREVSSWWLIPVAIDGDPTQRESYQPLGRIPYYEFLRRLPQDKGFKLDATRMVVPPLDQAVVRILGQAAD